MGTQSKKAGSIKISRVEQLPYITLAIIVLNIVIAIITRWNMEYYAEVYAKTYGLIPDEFKLGSLVTYSFLHDGYFHLTLNMLLLYLFGRRVESSMGKLEYVLFYIGAAVVSALVHIAMMHATLSEYYTSRVIVGASGAVSGIIGIYAVRFHKRTFKLAEAEIPTILLIMAWLVLQLVLGIIGLYRDEVMGLGLKQVGYWSHLGGFAFGIGVALMSNMALAGEREYLMEQAFGHYTKGNFLEAIRYHETLLEYEPDNPDSYAEIGRLWALLKEEEDSLRNYNIAIELYISSGKEAKALNVADEMVRFWPNINLAAQTKYKLATYLEEAGQLRPALISFRRIAEDYPGSAEAQMSLLRVGHIQLEKLNNSSAAIAVLKCLMDAYPNSEWLYYAKKMAAQAQEKT